MQTPDLEDAVHEACVAQVVQPPETKGIGSVCLRSHCRGMQFVLVKLFSLLCWVMLAACMRSLLSPHAICMHSKPNEKDSKPTVKAHVGPDL